MSGTSAASAAFSTLAAVAAVAAAMATGGCRRAAPDATGAVDAPSSGPAVHVQPRADRQLSVGEIVAAAETCHLVELEAWDARAPGCGLVVSRCGAGEQRTACSGSDALRLACGERRTVCGRDVQCDCPTGEAPPADDPSGTLRLASGASPPFGDPSCRAVPLARDHLDDGVTRGCVLDVERCRAREACERVRQAIACDVVGEVCGRPVRCVCR